MKPRKLRETVKKSVIQYIGYGSFYEDRPKFFVNIDLKQQYIRNNCVGRNDLHKQTCGFLVKSFLFLNSTSCTAKEIFLNR